MVVFWPLGIWMASQSRFNVNSVFSYIVSCLCHSERRREISGCIWNERVLPRRWKQLYAYYAINRENDERLRHVESEVRRSAVNDLRITSLVHIPLVALLAFQLLDVLVRLIDALAALLLDNLAQGRINILGHATRVAAHEKLRALGIDPFPDLGRIVSQLVLDIDFVNLIA